MADAIKDTYQVEPKLVAGSGGIFDVEADGQMIFSKHQTGRFPEENEVLDLLKPVVK